MTAMSLATLVAVAAATTFPPATAAFSTVRTALPPPLSSPQTAAPFANRRRSSRGGRRGLDGAGARTAATMVRYDDLMERMPSKPVVEAAERAGGDPVVASDVAAEAGVSLSQARKDLSALVALSRGDIAVSSDGDLVYRFPENLSSVMSSNNSKFRAVSLWREKVKPLAEYATRVGFGVVLLVSLFAIFSTIFFVMSSSNSSSDDRRDNRRGGGGMPMFNMFWGPSPFDFFYYRPYYSRYYSTPGSDRQRDPDEMGFLESVFSYVFGDGDPNGDVEERRLNKVADVIRRSGGAVTAEQLAPYCDDAPMPPPDSVGDRLDDDEERAYVDESFVLPIVTQLDGEPRVTEDGDIVYVFPELMTSASSSVGGGARPSKARAKDIREARVLRRAGLDRDASSTDIQSLLTMNGIRSRGALERSDLINVLEKALPQDDEKSEADDAGIDDPTLLQEREYKFSLASDFQKVLAAGLGAVNLGGALYLGNILGQIKLYDVQLPSYFGLVQSFFPLLLGYAVLYNVIPLVRNFRVGQKNDAIKRRNTVRRNWRTVLEVGAGSVKRKLAAAAAMGKRMKQLGSTTADEVVFDSREGSEGVEERRQQVAMKDFDKALEPEERSVDGGSWE